jgi:hypothetical protein
MLTRIYHKKDEQFNIEFFQDEECKQAFNFENIKNLYIELIEGDCTPVFKLSNKLWSLSIKANIFTPIWYLGFYDGISPQTPLITLADLENMDFSKYILTDNAILFLNKDDADKYSDKCEAWFLYQENFPTRESNSQMDIRDYKKITIFIESYTESEIKKTNDVAKELKEKYGVAEVNVFALHCFIENPPPAWAIVNQDGSFGRFDNKEQKMKNAYFDKLITTNSTGILKVENSESLQVINCFFN